MTIELNVFICFNPLYCRLIEFWTVDFTFHPQPKITLLYILVNKQSVSHGCKYFHLIYTIRWKKNQRKLQIDKFHQHNIEIFFISGQLWGEIFGIPCEFCLILSCFIAINAIAPRVTHVSLQRRKQQTNKNLYLMDWGFNIQYQSVLGFFKGGGGVSHTKKASDQFA